MNPVSAIFGAGVALNLPGIWYLDALKDIARSHDSTVEAVLWILVFVVIMFALAEVPLIGFAVSPAATRAGAAPAAVAERLRPRPGHLDRGRRRQLPDDQGHRRSGVRAGLV